MNQINAITDHETLSKQISSDRSWGIVNKLIAGIGSAASFGIGLDVLTDAITSNHVSAKEIVIGAVCAGFTALNVVEATQNNTRAAALEAVQAELVLTGQIPAPVSE